MRNILILQNGRIGDILQTTPLIVGLKEKHPGCHITMTVNKLFADLAFALEGVDEVIYFDQNGMYEVLSDPKIPLVDKYDLVKDFVDRLRAHDYDLIINLPSDANNHILATILKAKEVRGCIYTPDRVLSLRHPAMIFFYTIPLIRELNRFNVVDLHNIVGQVQPQHRRLFLPIGPEADKFAVSFLREHGVKAGDYLVALQPGASEERKRWPYRSFARLADMLNLRPNVRVILCGSTSEAPLGEKIATLCSGPIINAIGKTTLSQLAALLHRCNLLVTNDTGTMHIGAAAGTRVIDLSTGPVHFRETGPYGSDHIVVYGDIECFPCNFDAACHHLSCRELIAPEVVAKLVWAVKDGIGFADLEAEDFPNVRIYVSRFNDVGRIEYEPAFPYPCDAKELLSRIYAQSWELKFGMRRQPKPMADLIAEVIALYATPDADELKGELDSYAADLDHLSALLRKAIDHLSEALKLVGSNIGGSAVSALSELVQKVCEEIIIHGKAHLSVRPLTSFLELAVNSQPPGTIRQILKSYLELCLDLSSQADFVRDSVLELKALCPFPESTALNPVPSMASSRFYRRG